MLTWTVHVDERVGEPGKLGVNAADNDGSGPQPLRLAHFADEFALPALDECYPLL